jgi:alpha-beta hydrolase superfamily lysophospholipase
MKGRFLIVVLLTGLLCACAPGVQQAARPPLGFSGPRLEAQSFVSFDGSRLPLEVWTPPEGQETRAVIVGLHGMNDDAQAFWMAGPWWAKRGIATYAYDQRGFGQAPGRGVWGGRRLMTEDLRVLAALLRARYPHATLVVAGESMGGAVAIEAFASERPPDADRLILLSPAVWGWHDQPLINHLALWIAARLIGGHPIEPPRAVTKHITASDNFPELRRMGIDPGQIWGTRPDAVYGLVDLMDHASQDTARLRIPTAYFYGAHDELIPKSASLRAAARLPAQARTAYYPEGWHLLLRDYQAETVWRDVESFIGDPAAPWPSGAAPIPPPDHAGRGKPHDPVAKTGPSA